MNPSSAIQRWRVAMATRKVAGRAAMSWVPNETPRALPRRPASERSVFMAMARAPQHDACRCKSSAMTRRSASRSDAHVVLCRRRGTALSDLHHDDGEVVLGVAGPVDLSLL